MYDNYQSSGSLLENNQALMDQVIQIVKSNPWGFGKFSESNKVWKLLMNLIENIEIRISYGAVGWNAPNKKYFGNPSQCARSAMLQSACEAIRGIFT